MDAARARFKEIVHAARKELAAFHENQRFVTLAQACEKAWMAFIIVLELKSGETFNARKRPYPVAERLGLADVYFRFHELHVFHYEGSVAFDFDEVAAQAAQALVQLEALLRQEEGT